MEAVDHVAILKYLEVSNFKSFKDVQRIGPFKRNFTAVVGRNGAGNKSDNYSPVVEYDPCL